jgi:2-hydroxy-6-oxonona-2,4-dienedioate hydrolase
MAATATTHKYVELSHGRTRYLEAGTGHPVILLHGSSIEQGADDWLPYLAPLGQHFRVLAPDLVGWPPSDTFEDINSFPYLVDFVREFQDALGIQSSHLVGASMGAWIAALFAYESRERVDKLVITGNPGFVGGPNAHISNWHAPSDDEIREWVLKVTKDAGLDQEALIAEKLQKVHEPGFVDAFARIMRHMGSTANRQRYSLKRRLPHVTAPTLLLIGQTDPAVQHAEQAQKVMPNARLTVLPAGHRLHIEIPDQVAQTLGGFLR